MELANELQEKQNENLRIKKDTKPKFFESNNDREVIICKDSKQVSPNINVTKSSNHIDVRYSFSILLNQESITSILEGDGSENKRVLKDEPTFMQPKEVGEKAISNEIRKQVLEDYKKQIDNFWE